LWGKGAYERDSIDGADTKYSKLNRVCSGDIIVNKIWARNGSVSVIDDALADCYCSGEFPLFVPNRNLIEPRWFYWLTHTRWFWNQCDIQSRGTSGKNRIRPEKFLAIEIPLPPLDEQKRILKTIDSVSDKLQQTTKLVERARIAQKAMLRSAYQSISKTAIAMQIGEIAPLTRRPVEIESGGQYPELGVRSFGKGIFHKPTLRGSDITWQKLFRVRTNDVVFSNIKAWEGAIAVAKTEDNERVGSHRYLTCQPKRGKITANYLCFHLLTNKGLQDIGKASPGSADRNRTLGMKALELIEVPVPPFEKQQWFDSLCRTASKITQSRKDISPQSQAIIPAILDRAFKGEL